MGGVDHAVEAGQAVQGRDRDCRDVGCDGGRGGPALVLRGHWQQGVLRGDALRVLRPPPAGRCRGDVVAARSQRLLHAVQDPDFADAAGEGTLSSVDAFVVWCAYVRVCV